MSLGQPVSHPLPQSPSMIEPETRNPDERYVFEERLALLGVIDREPTDQEHRMAMGDVLEYRKRVRELVEEAG